MIGKTLIDQISFEASAAFRLHLPEPNLGPAKNGGSKMTANYFVTSVAACGWKS
jgi:hypothetical protein